LDYTSNISIHTIVQSPMYEHETFGKWHGLFVHMYG